MFPAPFNRNLSILFLGAAATFAATPKKPLMGWSSWNCYYENISEAAIKKQADAMVSSGLVQAGYEYINIDDGFFDGRNADGSLKINSTRFPNGFKPVVDYIHSKGLKAGFYSDAGSNMCAQMYGTETGGKGTGLYQHEQQDLDLAFKTWGFDYIKVDYCGGRQSGMDEQTRYTAIANALKATGRDDVVYNICRWQFVGGWVATLGNSWRIADDIGPSWSHVTRILDTNRYLAGFASPGHYNDMDMLEVGNGNWSTEEYKAHFALWSIHSSPMVLGNDLSTMSAAVKSILTNAEVLALNQDTFGIQASRLSEDGGGGEAYAKRLGGPAGTERGVVMFNRSSSARTISVNWKDLDLEGSATVRDLWAHKDLGAFESSYSASVPSHGAVAIRVSGGKSKLQETFEAEYAWMNNFKLTKSLAIQANQARPVADASCSRGSKVSYLGNNAGNFLEFRNVHASRDGTHRLTLVFQSGESRSATLTVNGRDTLLADLNSGAFNKRDSVVVPVALRSGPNTIRLANATAYMPDIDAIRIDLNSAPVAIDGSRKPPAPIQARLRRIDAATLEIEMAGTPLQVTLSDLSGRLLWSGNTNRIPLEGLSPGAYLVNARSSEGSWIGEFTRM